jgi:hypothetical protein
MQGCLRGICALHGEIYSDALGEATQFEGTEEYAGEHRSIEATGVGVAQGGVVAAEQSDLVGQEVLGSMAEGVGGAPFDDAFVKQMREVAVPGDLTQADDDADLGECGDLGRQVRRTVANLLRRGFVAGRGATDDRTDPDLAQLEAVVAAGGGWFTGQAEFVKNRVHEVAGAVAGERTPRPVGSVGARSEAEDEDAGVGIAESGDRFRPVFLIAVRFATRLADATNVGDESRAASAICDVLLQLIEHGEGMFWDRPLGGHEESSLEPGNCFAIVGR